MAGPGHGGRCTPARADPQNLEDLLPRSAVNFEGVGIMRRDLRSKVVRIAPGVQMLALATNHLLGRRSFRLT